VTEYERGLNSALAIARAEEQKWLREAEAHARNYWGGMSSQCARNDIKRAKIARRIADKITLELKKKRKEAA
jgi:hypothetical protein